jgi:hypothetical protein
MANDSEFQNERDPKFSFGVRESEQAHAAQRLGAQGLSLALARAPRKSANGARGFDPYNSSGSFDRKKNWQRIGKR